MGQRERQEKVASVFEVTKATLLRCGSRADVERQNAIVAALFKSGHAHRGSEAVRAAVEDIVGAEKRTLRNWGPDHSRWKSVVDDTPASSSCDAARDVGARPFTWYPSRWAATLISRSVVVLPEPATP